MKRFYFKFFNDVRENFSTTFVISKITFVTTVYKVKIFVQAICGTTMTHFMMKAYWKIFANTAT